MGYTALDFIYAITDACNYSTWAQDKFKGSSPENSSPCESQNDNEHLLFSTSVPSEVSMVSMVSEVSWEAEHESGDGSLECEGRTYASKPYTPEQLITHVIYLKHGEIPVDRVYIEGMGIECIEMVSDVPGAFNVPELKDVLLTLMQ